MVIYYGLEKSDINETFFETLKSYETNKLDEYFVIAILRNQPFEFFTEACNYLPSWLSFSLIDIFYDLDLLPNQKNSDGKTFRNNFYMNFIDYLIRLEVPVKDFLNYTALFDIERENHKIYYVLLEQYIVKNINREILKFSKFFFNLNRKILPE